MASAAPSYFPGLVGNVVNFQPRFSADGREVAEHLPENASAQYFLRIRHRYYHEIVTLKDPIFVHAMPIMESHTDGMFMNVEIEFGQANVWDVRPLGSSGKAHTWSKYSKQAELTRFGAAILTNDEVRHSEEGRARLEQQMQEEYSNQAITLMHVAVNTMLNHDFDALLKMQKVMTGDVRRWAEQHKCKLDRELTGIVNKNSNALQTISALSNKVFFYYGAKTRTFIVSEATASHFQQRPSLDGEAYTSVKPSSDPEVLAGRKTLVTDNGEVLISVPPLPSNAENNMLRDPMQRRVFASSYSIINCAQGYTATRVHHSRYQGDARFDLDTVLDADPLLGSLAYATGSFAAVVEANMVLQLDGNTPGSIGAWIAGHAAVDDVADSAYATYDTNQTLTQAAIAFTLSAAAGANPDFTGAELALALNGGGAGLALANFGPGAIGAAAEPRGADFRQTALACTANTELIDAFALTTATQNAAVTHLANALLRTGQWFPRMRAFTMFHLRGMHAGLITAAMAKQLAVSPAGTAPNVAFRALCRKGLLGGLKFLRRHNLPLPGNYMLFRPVWGGSADTMLVLAAPAGVTIVKFQGTENGHDAMTSAVLQEKYMYAGGLVTHPHNIMKVPFVRTEPGEIAGSATLFKKPSGAVNLAALGEVFKAMNTMAGSGPTLFPLLVDAGIDGYTPVTVDGKEPDERMRIAGAPVTLPSIHGYDKIYKFTEGISELRRRLFADLTKNSGAVPESFTNPSPSSLSGNFQPELCVPGTHPYGNFLLQNAGVVNSGLMGQNGGEVRPQISQVRMLK